VIKIANIIEDGRLAGPQIRMMSVAKMLDSDQYETTIVLPKKDNRRFKKKIINYGLRFKEQPIHRLTKEKKHLFFFVFNFAYEIIVLRKYFKQGRFDIVHVSGGSWQWKGVIAGKLAGCKVLWHLNDTQTPSYIRYIFRFLASRFADGFIVAGNKVEQYYLSDVNLDRKIVKEIQAPVDGSFFDPDCAENNNKLLKCKGIKVVTIANINPAKGLENFIRSAVGLNAVDTGVEFFIIGPVYKSQKTYFDQLKKLMDNKVHFLGAVNNVRGILKEADIYVCSSVAEASPTAVWEAMAMGKPIVSTNVGDVSRFVKNGVNGFIVDVNDELAMTGVVRQLVNNPILRKKFGLKSREVALKSLDISRCVKLHEEVYVEILAE